MDTKQDKPVIVTDPATKACIEFLLDPEGRKKETPVFRLQVKNTKEETHI